MVHTIRIAIDVMGGDFGPRVTVPAAVKALAGNASLQLTLVGDLALIESSLRLAGVSLPAKSIEILHTSDVVSAEEKPATALRNKTASSLYRAIALVAEGKADACVSAGNTGAMMAIGWKVLGTYVGIDRPAICVPMPASNGATYILDMGANVDCTPEQLLQFAIMGAGLVRVVHNKERPRVALLNVGSEAGKGNHQVQEAALLLQRRTDFDYQGFIEADGLFSSNVDVVVCDGFVGNIALKSIEGAARFIDTRIKAMFTQNMLRRLAGWLALPVLRQLRAEIDPARYNGASFLGLNGTLVKSHGNADVAGFYMAICQAEREVNLTID